MAGKSTIREAITGGDGKSIGKGAQRTTRDIRFYQWEGLRLVDTPGIAAYLGEQDREIAVSVVDESDLILFISSSDSIQEEEIEGLSCIRGQNKPLIFVLNVKEDLTKAVRLRRFLSDPHRLFAEEKIGGHIRRLERIVRDKLSMQAYTTVPIHAQAAFLATRPEHATAATVLMRGSRLDDLLNALKREVVTTGPIRRIQCISDSLALHLTDLGTTLNQQADHSFETAALLATKVDQLQDWEAQCIKVCEEVIPARLAQHLQPLRNAISAFVDENIERSDFAARWNREIESLKLNDWAKVIQRQIIEETEVQLQEFARQLRADAEFLSFDVDSEPEAFDASDVKHTLKWIGVGGSVLASVAGVAAMIAGSNIWNPIGWAAAAVGIGAWLLSFFFEDRETKLQKQKRRTADELRTFVDKLEANINSELLNWFRDRIAGKEIRRVIADTEALRSGMDAIGKQLCAGAAQLRAMVDALNIRVYSRAAMHVVPSFADTEIISVARDPGVLGLAVVSAKMVRDGFASDLGQALNEKIIAVQDSNPGEIIQDALRKFGMTVDRVRVSGSRASVKVGSKPASDKINRQHIALIARALGMNIELEQAGHD